MPIDNPSRSSRRSRNNSTNKSAGLASAGESSIKADQEHVKDHVSHIEELQKSTEKRLRKEICERNKN
jgi:50S ribosomal subunit-associated GTPase HflX